MTLWLLDTLLTQEEEAWLLEQGAIAFCTPLPDLTRNGSEHAVREAIRAAEPEETPERVEIDAARIWTFVDRLLPEDVVALVCGEGGHIRLGEITGPYFYNADAPETLRHLKPVRWLHDEPLPLARLLKTYMRPERPRLIEITEEKEKDRILSPVGLSRKPALRYIPWIIAGMLVMRLFVMVLENLRTAGVL